MSNTERHQHDRERALLEVEENQRNIMDTRKQILTEKIKAMLAVIKNRLNSQFFSMKHGLLPEFERRVLLQCAFHA